MSFTFELGLKITPGLTLNNSVDTNTITTSQQILSTAGGSSLEQSSELETESIINGSPNLVGLAHVAFAQHRHMILDPDSVWITIERGLAIHITQNAEKLRQQFVNFEGKKTLSVRRDEFVRGSKNDWEGCFDEFSEKIGEQIGKKKDLIVGNFSCTGKLQRVASEIVLMDAMSKYFNYRCRTCCSIPLVTLEGEVKDWENIRDRVRALSEFDLKWWTDQLLPVLDQIVETSKGNPDLDFWRSWYKTNGGSGGPFISGHINKFFPYLDIYDGFKRNEFADGYHGPTSDTFVPGFSKVPFVWEYYGTNYPMQFIGGIVGIKQDKLGAVSCAFGWGVKDADVPITSFPIENFAKDMVVKDKDGDTGKLKKAEADVKDDGSKILSDVVIEWENKGTVSYRKYELDSLYVPEK